MADHCIIPEHQSIYNKRECKGNSSLINKIKYLIIIAYIFGLNRLYLLKLKKVFTVLSYLYNFVLTLLASYVIFLNIDEGTSLIKLPYVILGVEHILLITALILNKGKLDKFYRELKRIDESLNITNDTSLTVPVKIIWWLLTLIILFEFSKFSLSLFVQFFFGVIYDSAFTLSLRISMFLVMTRNFEQILYKFHFSLLLIRLKILKAHVLKRYSVENNWCEDENLDKVEMLYKRATLDVGTLHEMYVSLHKCWLRWNSVCSTPLTLILCSNELSTIVSVSLAVLKIFAVSLPGNKQTTLPSGFQLRGLYQAMVSLKCFFMTLIPCYYASATRTQASVIHATLSDALNLKNLDAVERLQVEAFLELTKDSTFSFSLFSIIKVDMFLPLRYLNFCLTYVIITINFSKFIK